MGGVVPSRRRRGVRGKAPLHSSSLDLILENDDADEQQHQQQNQLEDLLSNFALALNVRSHSGPSSQLSRHSNRG